MIRNNVRLIIDGKVRDDFLLPKDDQNTIFRSVLSTANVITGGFFATPSPRTIRVMRQYRGEQTKLLDNIKLNTKNPFKGIDSLFIPKLMQDNGFPVATIAAKYHSHNALKAFIEKGASWQCTLPGINIIGGFPIPYTALQVAISNYDEESLNILHETVISDINEFSLELYDVAKRTKSLEEAENIASRSSIFIYNLKAAAMRTHGEISEKYSEAAIQLEQVDKDIVNTIHVLFKNSQKGENIFTYTAEDSSEDLPLLISPEKKFV